MLICHFKADAFFESRPRLSSQLNQIVIKLLDLPYRDYGDPGFWIMLFGLLRS